MKNNIRKAVKCYAPVYTVDEFNESMKTNLDEGQYKQLINELGVETKQQSNAIAEMYARRTKNTFLKRRKEIADKEYIFGFLER
tara:strand:+ start:72 stop:323 length:252 start_codon:yes stop_codon:yes gene_type:complete